MSKYNIIAFSGTNGSGKSTQAQEVFNFLKNKNVKVTIIHLTKPLAAAAFDQKEASPRKFLSSSTFPVLFMIKDILKTYGRIIIKVLQNYAVIILDRYSVDIIAKKRYFQKEQGVGKRIEKLVSLILPKPAVYFYINIAPEIAFSRDKVYDLSYYQKMKNIYEQVVSNFPEINKINGNKSLSDVTHEITDYIKKYGL